MTTSASGTLSNTYATLSTNGVYLSTNKIVTPSNTESTNSKLIQYIPNSMCHTTWVEQYFMNRPDFNRTSVCEIPAGNGISMDKIFLKITLPDLSNFTGMSYNNFCTYNLIKSIKLVIGQSTIFEYNPDLLYVIDKVNGDLEKIKKLCQPRKSIYYPIDLTKIVSDIQQTTGEKLELLQPGLPLVFLDTDKIKLYCEFGSIFDIVETNQDVLSSEIIQQLKNLQLTEATVCVNYFQTYPKCFNTKSESKSVCNTTLTKSINQKFSCWVGYGTIKKANDLAPEFQRHEKFHIDIDTRIKHISEMIVYAKTCPTTEITSILLQADGQDLNEASLSLTNNLFYNFDKPGMLNNDPNIHGYMLNWHNANFKTLDVRVTITTGSVPSDIKLYFMFKVHDMLTYVDGMCKMPIDTKFFVDHNS